MKKLNDSARTLVNQRLICSLSKHTIVIRGTDGDGNETRSDYEYKLFINGLIELNYKLNEKDAWEADYLLLALE